MLRKQGSKELKRDILSCYKQHDCNLKARMRVRLEGKEGAGSGPIREFLVCAMKIVQEGIGSKGKPLIFFEGESDHMLPVHDQTLRCTGAFRAVGRIIAHSVLHGGPYMYGLSTAVKQYWAATSGNKTKDQDIATQVVTIVIEDIPDIELRQYISEVNVSIVSHVENERIIVQNNVIQNNKESTRECKGISRLPVSAWIPF